MRVARLGVDGSVVAGEILGLRCGRRPQPLRGGEVGHRDPLSLAAAGSPVETLAELVEALLGGGDGGVVGDGAPPALRRGVVGLLHHALAVAVARRAEIDPDRVVLRGVGERRRQGSGRRGADRGHPVEPPSPRETAELARDPVQGLDQVREVLGVREHRPPPPRVRQRPHQQMRFASQPPRPRRVRQLDPVPLGLLPGRVGDDRGVAALRGLTRLAVRPQPMPPDRRGQRRIRPGEPQPDELVVQRRGPQVRVLAQAQPAVLQERLRQRRLPPDPDLGHPPALEIAADGLAADERGTAGQHLEQDATEGGDVQAVVERVTLQLLAGHVGGRADDRAGGGQSFASRRVASRRVADVDGPESRRGRRSRRSGAG